jgi:hypothetical protein
MSIATLKRKTQTQYNNMSVGSKDGFSLNGTHRSQGYVGQTSLSRSLRQTPMKGDTVKGHGGCCGKFHKNGIVQSAVTSLNDPNVVKPSVLGNHGMISTHYRWIHRPSPFIAVKPDNNNNLNDQSDYINRIRKAAIADGAACHIQKQPTCIDKSCAIYANGLAGYSLKRRGFAHVTKPKSDFIPISSGEYIDNLHKECSKNNDIVFVPTKAQNTPFGCG